MARRPADSRNWGGARAGGGRPPAEEPIKMKAFYLPVRLVAKLAKKAAAARTSPSKLLRAMLERMKG